MQTTIELFKDEGGLDLRFIAPLPCDGDGDVECGSQMATLNETEKGYQACCAGCGRVRTELSAFQYKITEVSRGR